VQNKSNKLEIKLTIAYIHIDAMTLLRKLFACKIVAILS